MFPLAVQKPGLYFHKAGGLAPGTPRSLQAEVPLPGWVLMVLTGVCLSFIGA
jgi:hypothetical protein